MKEGERERGRETEKRMILKQRIMTQICVCVCV